MAWYKKYLSVYEHPFENAPARTIQEIKDKLQVCQSGTPQVSVVLIAHNEASRVLACLWSLSENKCCYPMEIIGVNNNSTDHTEKVFQAVGLTYFNESQKGPGHARSCGQAHSRGKYCICIDCDTMYPPRYIETMVKALEKPGTVAAYSLWSYIPDKEHPWLGIKLYEFMRDTHLLIQSFKRPELCVRGMVFAYHLEQGRQVGYRTDIIRGEDGSLALGLKPYGKLRFIRKRKARAVTGYGTLSADGSFFNSFKKRLFKYLKGMGSYFTTKTEYKDEDSNMIK